MSTNETTTGRTGAAESHDFYIPAMPQPSAEAGRIEQFIKGLDKGPRPE